MFRIYWKLLHINNHKWKPNFKKLAKDVHRFFPKEDGSMVQTCMGRCSTLLAITETQIKNTRRCQPRCSWMSSKGRDYEGQTGVLVLPLALTLTPRVEAREQNQLCPRCLGFLIFNLFFALISQDPSLCHSIFVSENPAGGSHTEGCLWMK